MRIFKFVIFYTFIGIYESVLFVSSTAAKVKNSFTRTISQSKTQTSRTTAPPQRMRGALLKTAFRSIL
ncbi:hypothetical protein JCM19275_613 [Nonlabens ulvanivorans]|uniref:Uncharacterized protein n=1 Tax=Nonlabens ulvanivorans TaxID=906888 RepID=A0A090X3K8_NONUL|nr:hypothetical protein [Nonlabens ulvanivorans]GAL76207.1 hypothetical protein JCM19275_613 [Nonlabens ulvanivorans]